LFFFFFFFNELNYLFFNELKVKLAKKIK
jgi:hypothetical protein